MAGYVLGTRRQIAKQMSFRGFAAGKYHNQPASQTHCNTSRISNIHHPKQTENPANHVNKMLFQVCAYITIDLLYRSMLLRGGNCGFFVNLLYLLSEIFGWKGGKNKNWDKDFDGLCGFLWDLISFNQHGRFFLDFLDEN
ncbi:MAG: hypothetical protein JEZ07_11600 [Phycisphaerae bacterium]|nr:hypothetical protein [Phycisphaerae bacterium]